MTPDLNQVILSLQNPYKTGNLTNFGELHEWCVRYLALMYGGFWLPVTNGSVAIEVALRTLPKHVKRIAVPNFTFAATIQAVIRAGLKPVIFQCGQDMGFDMKLIQKNHRSFDAVLGVVPFGYELESNQKLKEFCEMLNIPLVWDRAGAFPMIDKDHVCTFSLHASKGVPVGEGGLIYFPHGKRSDYEKAKRLTCFGFNDQKECTDESGFNFKMDEVRCAILKWFLENDVMVGIRKLRLNRAMIRYKGALYKHCHFTSWKNQLDASLIVLNLKKAASLQKYLESVGITSRRYYAPLLNEHHAFKKYRFIGKTKKTLSNWLALPSDVSDDESFFIIEHVKAFYEGNV